MRQGAPLADITQGLLYRHPLLCRLGLVIIWGVGFSHIDVLHNAAHDTRHSNAFPCH